MRHRELSIEETEAAAVKTLSDELAAHNQLAVRAFNLVGSTCAALPVRPSSEVPKSCKVANTLLLRISNDLRGVTILANHGYGIQAAALAASLYESAYTVAYIGGDETLAEEWINHEDPKKPFRDVRSLTEKGLANLGFQTIKEQAEIEYKVYQQLCMSKHANPLFQMRHGIRVEDKERKFVLFNGPDTSPEAVRVCWFALEHSSAAAGLVAASSLVNNHVPPGRRQPLAREIEAMGRLRKRLEQKAKERWGTEDPFRKKW